MQNRGAMMKWGANQEGLATDQVRGVGGLYQAGDNADEEKLTDLEEMLEVKPIEPVTMQNGWVTMWIQR